MNNLNESRELFLMLLGGPLIRLVVFDFYLSTSSVRRIKPTLVISFWVAFRVSLFLYTLARLNTYVSTDLDNPDTAIIFVVQAIEGGCFILWGILLYRMVLPKMAIYKQMAWSDTAMCIVFPAIWLFVLQ